MTSVFVILPTESTLHNFRQTPQGKLSRSTLLNDPFKPEQVQAGRRFQPMNATQCQLGTTNQ